MYTITFERIRQQPSSQAEMAMTIVTWVYLAKRILKVYELQHALAVQAGDTALVEDGIRPEETLLECCLGLVVIEQETSTVRFAHFTLQEYLDKHWQTLFPTGHSLIASTCLTYLNFEHSHLPRNFWGNASNLSGYASNFLGDHLREDTNEELNRQTLKLFTNTKKFQLVKISLVRSLFAECPSPLHWAAWFGIRSFVAELLQINNYSINTWDNRKHTPLSYAAAAGHEPVVKLLLSVEGKKLIQKTGEDEHHSPMRLKGVEKQLSSYYLE
jgi:hypothetical protein